MSRVIKMLRIFPNRRRKLKVLAKEYHRMGKICNKYFDKKDSKEGKFYQGAQFGMVYAEYILGYITKEEYQQLMIFMMLLND